MGGRGKTPLVAEIASLLLAAGERPAILSRGYGRRVVDDGAVIVSDGRHILADVDRAGDEPLLLARSVPGAAVVVCDQRAIAGALAERALGVTVHLLDDGFQHRALARDVDIVAMAAADFVDRRVPFGRLREPVTALSRADAVIIDGDLETVDSRGWSNDGAAVFSLSREIGAPEPLEPDRPWPNLDDGVVAVTGIAAPRRFVRALESQGLRVAYAIEYRDHHVFTRGDVAHIAETVREWQVPAVLTTAKDASRLLVHRPLPVPIAAVPLRVRVEPAGAFQAWLLSRLAEARS